MIAGLLGLYSIRLCLTMAILTTAIYPVRVRVRCRLTVAILTMAMLTVDTYCSETHYGYTYYGYTYYGRRRWRKRSMLTQGILYLLTTGV